MIIEAVLFMGLLGLVIGIILQYASSKLEIIKQEGEELQKLTENILKALPGINCGACGFGNCRAYAEAICNGEKPDKCVPGKSETIAKIKKILITC